MKKLLITVAALAVIGSAAVYFGEDHQRYLAFSADRDAWHRSCDVHVGKAVDGPAAKACAEKLHALTAYAKQQGW